MVESLISMRSADGGVTSDCGADFGMTVRECLCDMTEYDSEVLLGLSERAVRLLFEMRGTVVQQRTEMRSLLSRAGFLKGSDRLDFVRFSEAFRMFYGSGVLGRLSSEFDDAYLHSWPRDTLKFRTGTHHPMRRLLIEHFLESYLAGCHEGVQIGCGPWLCQNPAAEHFGRPTIERYTILRHHKLGARAGRFLCSCGFEFTARLDAADARGQPIKMRVTQYGGTMTSKIQVLARNGYSPSKTARLLGVPLPAVKAILAGGTDGRRSGDEETARRMRDSVGQHRVRKTCTSYREHVDWSVVDDDLCQRVQAAEKEILSRRPPTRVTKVAIRRLVGDKRLASAGSSRHLPKTVGALSSAHESGDQIQCRKARWVYEHWPDDKPVTAWRLRHIVGVKSGSRRVAVAELIDRLVAGDRPDCTTSRSPFARKRQHL
ncbi:TnsD family Tn7-like transposition protein [Paraburkholderia tropica]|uniref:TnsD family Tn7-like transposition protein n=1 Tax=Paraburkholderia tropica TaxID=92647 RepID=UPI002ABE2E48|nr:TnsD family Tn7-like transposition protein [Paraburkholderia tropica]